MIAKMRSTVNCFSFGMLLLTDVEYSGELPKKDSSEAELPLL